VPEPGAERMQKALADAEHTQVAFRVYALGGAATSRRALTNLTALCEEFLAGRFTLEVIDVYEHPELAASDHVIATPTVLRLSPRPRSRIVGDLSDRAAAIRALDLNILGGGGAPA
jgi:circadian clock protein KaiB